MSDKVSALKDALKKSRMKEIMEHFAKKVPDVADVHEHEMVGEGSTPKEAMDNMHEVHGDMPEDTCPMCHGGATPMSEGGMTVEDEDTIPTLNDESEDEEDDMSSQSRLGNQADVDDLPAIASLRNRKDKNKRI